jgi:hypothetical protein
MKLPRRGCLFDPDTGKILWLWDHNHEGDFEALPPLHILPDGSVQSLAQPQHLVLDLAELLAASEMAELVRSHDQSRIRRDAAGAIRVTRIVQVDDTTAIEIEHPVMTLRAARAAALAAKGKTS